MLKRLLSCLAVWLIVAGAATAAWAELESVSGINNTEVFADGDPANVALAPPGGPSANFPLWYKDTTGLKLTLCLDGEEGADPCHWEGAPVFTDAGCNVHFYEYENVVGFGNEGFYYKVQSYPFDIDLSVGGFAQLQYLVETTWGADTRFNPDTGQVNGQDIFLLDEAGQCVSSVGSDLHRVEEGYEMLFPRLRLRLLDAAPEGWYRMTHPYGVKTIFRPAAEVGIRTEVRQLVGDLLIPDPDNGWADPSEQNFLIALNDPYELIDATNPDPFNHPYIGLRDTGFINDGDYLDEVERLNLKSVGPFLYKPDYLTDPGLKIADENGVIQQYIGYGPNEANPAAAPGHPVTGSQFTDPLFPEEGLVNHLRVRYLAGDEANPPSDQDWLGAPVVGETSEFNVIGKVFEVPAVESVALTPNLTSPQLVGGQIEFSAAATGGGGSYEYRFWLKHPVTGWSVQQAYSATSSWVWDTTGIEPGQYFIQVDARNAGSTVNRDVADVVGFGITPPAATDVTLAAEPAGPQNPGAAVTFSAAGVGGSGSYQYRFWLKDPVTGWSVVQPYSTTASWIWDTTAVATGNYFIQVDVRSTGSTANREAAKVLGYSLAPVAATGVSLESDLASPQTVGTTVTFSAAGAGGSGSYEYRFWLKTGASWAVMQPYSSTASWAWDTSAAAAGNYFIQVDVRSAGSGARREAAQVTGFTLQ